jgi:histidinol phosphatase-like enzyme (inositol monophosphatase family)
VVDIEINKKFINVIKELSEISGDIIKFYYRKKSILIEQKENKTLVTTADKEAEKKMREHILKNFPSHGIIGEEFGSENEEAEYVWVLDPIDGTISFVHDVPLFVTLIGLMKNKKPILGAIDQPIIDCFCFGDNQNAWLNGEKIQTRKIDALDQATLLTTDVRNIGRWYCADKFQNLIEKIHTLRTWGDGFGYMLVASGKADIMLDPRMSVWDIMPIIPVVRGAGAVVTTFEGQDPVWGKSAVVAAANIHSQVLNILN